MKKITNEKQPFERLEISKDDLLRLFGVRIEFIIYEKLKLFYFGFFLHLVQSIQSSNFN